MSLFELNKVVVDEKESIRHGCSKLVDIIAVHGLNEHYSEAWTDPQTKVSWLKDLLPTSVRVARVLAYEYNASASSFRGGGSVDRIQQHAHTLVAAIQADRSLEGCSKRPIIFICHGLGGILVKKALVYSSTRRSIYVDHLYSVFVSTFAILFFGTPHNGMKIRKWHMKSRLNKLQVTGRGFKESQLLAAVECGSEALQTVTQDFSPLIKQFHVFFFWEEVRSTFGSWTGYVVEESSAAPLMDDTERAGIPKDHSGMVKFSDAKSSSYRTVVEALLRYCRQAPPVISGRWRYAEDFLARTRGQEAFELGGAACDLYDINLPFYYQTATPPRLQNKHFQIPEFISSISTGREDMSELVEGSLLAKEEGLPRFQRRYIIWGIEGSGKTQFCCQFAQDHREKFWGVFWIDATSEETSQHSFADIGKAGQVETTKHAAKHWLSHLEEPWLLIIDNADDPTMNLQDLFPEGERGNILVTTRNPYLSVHASVGSCEFKEPRKQEALLSKAVGIPSSWNASAEEAGNQIADALGYMVLSLIQAGAIILQKICGMTYYLDSYQQHRRQLSASRSFNPTFDHEQYTMISTWDLSFNSLESRGTEASEIADEGVGG